MWILGKWDREILFLYSPALVSICLSLLWPHLSGLSVVYALLATGVIDSGHVYTTAWRTYFHPDERSSHWGYRWFPVLFFFGFTLWFYSGIPHLWAFVVYATLYHHVRQVYGFSKWYQKLNHRTDKASDIFLYILSYLPMVIYHFRPGAIGTNYTERDLFLFPSPEMTRGLLFLYGAGVLSWLGYEVFLWRRGTRELNRLISVGFPAAVYAFCFLYGKTITQILFPLLFLHGIAYFAVLGQSLSRTQKRFSRKGVALFIVVLTALLLGLTESWFEENVVDYERGDSPFLSSLIVGLWLTPLFCHYAFDALIWRKDHREASLVFAKH